MVDKCGVFGICLHNTYFRGRPISHSIFFTKIIKTAITCGQEVDFKNSKMIRKEKGWTQSKVIEAIESLRKMNQGIEPLNIPLNISIF